MSWYRIGTVFTTAVNVGDVFALVDANVNPTGERSGQHKLVAHRGGAGQTGKTE